MNNTQHEICDNLYSFYDQISHCEGIYSEKQDYWSMIKNNPCNWPRLIYRIAPNLSEIDSSSELFKKVQSGIYPEVLIVTNDNIRKTDPFLRAQGFYPNQGWKGMAREFTG